MKKLLSWVITITLLLSLIPALPVSAEGEAYAVLGVQDGDRIILNPQIDGYTDFQHKVTIVDSDQVSSLLTSGTGTLKADGGFTFTPTATGIESVEFAIDGTIVTTDDEYPYEFIFTTEHKDGNTLTATIHKIDGGIETKTINYIGILGEAHESHLLNYDSGVLDESNNPTYNGNLATGKDIENGALKINGTDVTSVWLQPGVATSLMELGDTKLFYLDFDVYKNSADVTLEFAIAQGSSRANQVATSGTVGTAMPADKWVHVTVVADTKNDRLSAYMNGILFKHWEQASLDENLTITDRLLPYLKYGNDRVVYIDNYAVRTYDTARERSYSLTGVLDNEQIKLNTTAVPIHARTIGLADATGANKVVYKVDGETKATKTLAPFTWDMPFTDVNTTHEVYAEVYTVFGKKETNRVSYKTVYVCEHVERFNDTFEGKTGSVVASDVATFSTAQDRSGAYSYDYVDATDLGRTGTVVKIDRKEDVANTNGCLLGTRRTSVGVTDADGANPLVKFSFDFYLPKGKTYTSNDKIFLSDVASYQDGVVCDLSKFETGKWYSVVTYIDVPAREVISNVDGKTTVVKFVKDPSPSNNVVEGMVVNGSTNMQLFVKSFSDLYIDNVRASRIIVDETLTKSFVNGFNYVKDSDSVDTTVSFANMSNAPVEATVYFGLYNGNTLIEGWKRPITVAAKGFTSVTEDVAFKQGDQTGTTVRAFCWTKELCPIECIR